MNVIYLPKQQATGNAPADLLGSLSGVAQAYIKAVGRVVSGQLGPDQARAARRALHAIFTISTEPQPPTIHYDHEALCGFVRDASVVRHADVAARRAALIERTGASDRELLLAALEVVDELTAALSKARNACGPA